MTHAMSSDEADRHGDSPAAPDARAQPARPARARSRTRTSGRRRRRTASGLSLLPRWPQPSQRHRPAAPAAPSCGSGAPVHRPPACRESKSGVRFGELEALGHDADHRDSRGRRESASGRRCRRYRRNDRCHVVVAQDRDVLSARHFVRGLKARPNERRDAEHREHIGGKARRLESRGVRWPVSAQSRGSHRPRREPARSCAIGNPRVADAVRLSSSIDGPLELPAFRSRMVTSQLAFG